VGRILSTDRTTREDHKGTYSRKRGTSTATVTMTKSVTLLNSKLKNSKLKTHKHDKIFDDVEQGI
jgi:hypothetical protein